MLRPIDAEGTCRYSTGSPGREKALAVGEPPEMPINPGSTAAEKAATVSRRVHLRTLSLAYAISGPLSTASRTTAKFTVDLSICRSRRVGVANWQQDFHLLGACGRCPNWALLAKPRDRAQLHRCLSRGRFLS